ncbi:MAG: C40 family peptidase [Bacteroidales bacterium]|nr:C40 family peptidase [Bacteroidales bacterium]
MEAIAFCNIAVMPVRETASHQAEMVTQLLFGEAYKIINYESNGWAKILTLFDNYEGYIDTKQIALMHTSAYQKYYLDTRPLIVNTLTEVHDKIRNCAFIIPQGATLPFTSMDDHTICLGTELFKVPIISTTSSYSNMETKEQTLIDGSFNQLMESVALSFLNAPYLWGGRTIFGIDCSGFTQAVYKIMGIAIPRDASQQNKCGNNIPLWQAKTGDLAFFANSNGKITHVGLLLGEGKIIHASGKVRIDRIDETGIFCIERNEYSHQLHSIKRLL